MIRIASGCKTEGQFIAVFSRFCDGDSIFIATRTPKAVGDLLTFSITLADGDVLLRGGGKVVESYREKEGPFARPGMRIAFDDIAENSRPLLDRLADAARAARAKAARLGTSPGAARRGGNGKVPGNGKARKRMTIPEIPPVAQRRAGTPPPTPDAGRGPDEPEEPDEETRKVGDTTKPLGLPPPVTIQPRSRRGRKRPLSETHAPITSEDEAPDTVVQSSPPRGESSGVVTGTIRLQTLPGTGEEPAAPTEERTKGSSFILPANPFGELEEESLMAFVECTIYEETAPQPLLDEEEIGDAAPQAALGAVDFESALDRLSEEPEEPEEPAKPEEPEEAEEPARRLESELGDDEARGAEAAADEAPRRAEPAAVPPPAATPVPPAAAPAPSVAAPLEAGSLLGSRVPAKWLVAAAAMTLVVGLGLGYLLFSRSGSGSPSAAAPPQSAAVADAGAAASRPADAAALAAADQPADAAPAMADAAAAPATAVAIDAATDSEACTIKVASHPRGATVRAGDTELGKTPGTFEVACGKQRLSIDHPRYRPESRKIRLRAGKPRAVSVRLHRPTYRLRVKSRPNAARVWIDGRMVGLTPVTVQLRGYEHKHVKVGKPGYRTQTRRLYLKRNRSASFTLKRR